eukprot:jgi/Botrbrau1/15962/Bobra.0340s0010.1
MPDAVALPLHSESGDGSCWIWVYRTPNPLSPRPQPLKEAEEGEKRPFLSAMDRAQRVLYPETQVKWLKRVGG